MQSAPPMRNQMESTMNTYTDLRTGDTIRMWPADAAYACGVLGWPLVDSLGYWADSKRS